jgi:hypothetical protein
VTQDGPTAGHGPERTLDDVLSSGDSPAHPESTSTRTYEESRDRLARRAALARSLRQAPFPADRAALVDFLLGHAAPSSEVDALYVLPEGRTFASADEVGEFLAGARRPDTE